MMERIRPWVAPAYLLLCLFLGGSVQGVWSNMTLQLLALAILAWAFWKPRVERASQSEKQLQWLIVAGLAWIGVQLVPLPPALWTALPGRQTVADGYALLGQALPWLPISLAPYATLATILPLLPPLAILAAMLRQRAYTPQGIAWALAVGAVAGAFLGALQVATLDPFSGSSPWYLYEVTNFGVANGFFANGNHMAILLVATLPLLAALLATRSRESVPMRSTSRRHQPQLARSLGMRAIVLGAGGIVLFATVLNGSLAGLILGLPVFIASVLMVLKRRSRSTRLPVLALALALMAAASAMFVAPVQTSFADDSAVTSVESRRQIYRVATEIAADFAPVGSGLGTFDRVYHLYEDPAHVDRVYVNHAHNDYLELAVELGVPGILLFILFVVWWAASAVKPWRTSATDAYARAGTIATAAILAHSLLDFPLRTSAVTAVFAGCLVLMVRPWTAPPARTEQDLRPARHLSLDD